MINDGNGLPLGLQPQRLLDAGASGAVLGGVGSGWIEWLPNGRICPAAITNNPQRLLGPQRGTFLALRWGRRLRLLDQLGQGGVPGVDALAFQQRFPQARADMAIADWPFAISLRASAQFLPHQPEASSLPGVLWQLELQHLGVEEAEIELYCSWESILGVSGGGPRGLDLVSERRGTQVSAWGDERCGGLAHHLRACRGAPQAVGSTSIAARAPEGFQLRCWSHWNVLADEAELLQCLAAGELSPLFDAGSLPAVAAMLAERQAKPPSWDDPDPRAGGGRQAVDGMVHPAAVLGVCGRLAPGQSVTIPLALAWHCPQHLTRDQAGQDHGRYSARHGDAAAVAHTLLERGAEWEAAAAALPQQLENSDLPDWLVAKLLDDSVPLITNSVVDASGTMHTLESTPMMFGALGTLDQRLVSHIGAALFFPQWDRSELDLFASLQDADGSLPHFTGNYHAALGSSAVEYGITRWPDLAMSFIIQVLRHWMQGAAEDWLAARRPQVARAFDFLLAADEDGDGVPEGGSSWDVEHYPGCFIATGTLWLATLRAGCELAEHWQDPALAERLHNILPQASATVAGLWNGTGYHKYHDPRSGEHSDDLFIGQLEGDWVLRQLALAPVLDGQRASAAAAHLYATSADPGRYRLPPIQARADGSLCDRPYAWHAWPQYTQTFLDCCALYLGLEDQALAGIARNDWVARKLNASASAVTLWHDCRTGLPDFRFMGRDRYMSTPASWWVLSALSGLSEHLPRARLTLGSPWLRRGEGRVLPVITASFWGRVWSETVDGGLRLHLAVDRCWAAQTLLISNLRWRGSISGACDNTSSALVVRDSEPYCDIALIEIWRLEQGSQYSVVLLHN